MGAGLASLSVAGVPVLREWSRRREDGPFALAMNLLVPFSNRISGGFGFDGRRHALAPNLQGEPFPIHGDGFQRPWRLVAAEAGRAVLALDDGAIGPWRYGAQVEYELDATRLTVGLRLRNRADAALPFGAGFHPWFPRDAGTRLHFAAQGCWQEDSRHLPSGTEPGPVPPEWDFSRARALPREWVNNGFSGWGGVARIAQAGAGVSVEMRANGLDTLILYSPSDAVDFFCLEPVSHPVDAHNLPGQPGLAVLAPGQSLEVGFVLAWA